MASHVSQNTKEWVARADLRSTLATFPIGLLGRRDNATFDDSPQVRDELAPGPELGCGRHTGEPTCLEGRTAQCPGDVE